MFFGLDETNMPSYMDSASLKGHLFQSKQEILNAKLQGGQVAPMQSEGMQSQLNNPSVWSKADEKKQ